MLEKTKKWLRESMISPFWRTFGNVGTLGIAAAVFFVTVFTGGLGFLASLGIGLGSAIVASLVKNIVVNKITASKKSKGKTPAELEAADNSENDIKALKKDIERLKGRIAESDRALAANAKAKQHKAQKVARPTVTPQPTATVPTSVAHSATSAVPTVHTPTGTAAEKPVEQPAAVTTAAPVEETGATATVVAQPATTERRVDATPVTQLPQTVATDVPTATAEPTAHTPTGTAETGATAEQAVPAPVAEQKPAVQPKVGATDATPPAAQPLNAQTDAHRADTPAPATPGQSDIIKFYNGMKVRGVDYTIDTILGWDINTLNESDNAIYRLFPILSDDYSTEPILTQEDVNAFKTNPRLKAKLIESFKTIVSKIYGLHVETQNGVVKISKSANFDQRTPLWLNDGDRNFVRITRILSSLKHLGLPEYSLAFYNCLREIYADGKYKSIIGDSYEAWSNVVGKIKVGESTLAMQQQTIPLAPPLTTTTTAAVIPSVTVKPTQQARAEEQTAVPTVVPAKTTPAATTTVAPASQLDGIVDSSVGEAAEYNAYHFEGIAQEYQLLNASERPSTVFWRAMGGVGSLDANFNFITLDASKCRAREIQDTVSINHSRFIGKVKLKTRTTTLECDAKLVYGEDEFNISGDEIRSIVDSAQIRVARPMSLQFYNALKDAINASGLHRFWKFGDIPINALPEALSDEQLEGVHKKTEKIAAVRQQYLKLREEINKLLAEVKKDPSKYGMKPEDFNTIQALSLWQLGSLVIKSEKYYNCVVAGTNKIRQREVGARDELVLISACGVKWFQKEDSDRDPNLAETNRRLITEMFKGVLDAAGDGVLVIPAIGMGLWKGDPEIYWSAFFEAVQANGNRVKKIVVQPGAGDSKTVFERMLGERKMGNKVSSAGNKDILSIAQHIKSNAPTLQVSILNASDPDVTLASTVGEAVLQREGATIEENFTAMGTNGIMFESLTRVREEHHDRLFQLEEDGRSRSLAGIEAGSPTVAVPAASTVPTAGQKQQRGGEGNFSI